MSRRWQLALLFVTACVTACATTRGRADDAYTRGDYMQAAELYARLAAEKPGNAELAARRDDARRRALDALLVAADRARIANRLDDALPALRQLIEVRAGWQLPVDPVYDRPFEASLAADLAWSRTQIGAEAHGYVAARRPLAAETVLTARHAQMPLPVMQDLWPSLRAEIVAGGQAECRAAQPADAAAQPYLARLAAVYCHHFLLTATAPALPDLLGRVDTRVDVDGITDAQADRLEVAIAQVFAASPWYGAQAPGRLPVAVDGAQSARFWASEVMLEAPWVERIAYSDQEAYQEAYQEPYQDSETYTTQEPYTAYGTESYSCGTYDHPQTCTRSTSHTEYRTETHTRWVTRQRTAYRTAYRTVTRYRDEDRVYRYRGLQRDGAYAGSWTLALPLGPSLAPLQVRIADTAQQRGFDHDASFADAGVAPSRANLMTGDDWVTHLLSLLVPELQQRLVGRWQAAFCRDAVFSPETAARCAYGAPADSAVRSALAAQFGQDVDLVLHGMAPAAAPAWEPAAVPGLVPPSASAAR